MRQRVAIATALLNKPDLIIADEPTTALDVTIQGQILFEMQKLARETGAALIWITHDLAVVAELADRIAVMYAGRIVETGTVADVLDNPRHPYTRGLLDSVPDVGVRGTRARADRRHGAAPGYAPRRLRVRAAVRESHRRLPLGRPAGDGRGSAALPLPPSASSRRAAVSEPVLEVRGASKHFARRPTLAERILMAAGRAGAAAGGARGARAWTSRSSAARCSGSWANRAAASRRSPGSSPASIRRRRARCSSRAAR